MRPTQVVTAGEQMLNVHVCLSAYFNQVIRIELKINKTLLHKIMM